MDAKQFLKEKGISNNDFMDSGVADLIETLLTEYQALQLQQTGVIPRFISLVTSFDFNSINEKIHWLNIKREDIISIQHTKNDGFCLYYFKNEV
jgi:hypothetical protein